MAKNENVQQSSFSFSPRRSDNSRDLIIRITKLWKLDRVKGHAFIEYETPEDAAAALDNMHLSEIYGKIIRVTNAKGMKINDYSSYPGDTFYNVLMDNFVHFLMKGTDFNNFLADSLGRRYYTGRRARSRR